ncbi:unnamed protein product [Merluccius merluccius]
MAATMAPSNSTSGNESYPYTTKAQERMPPNHVYDAMLLCVYTAVLLSGVLGLVPTVRILQSNSRSLTSIAVLNLIFAHFLFLVTLPFRIYYYAAHNWSLGPHWCKVVSSMIHIHLYMSFIFYVIILVMRLLSFHRRVTEVAFNRRTHALFGSLAVWAVVAVALPCLIHFFYGNAAKTPDTTCFKFGMHIHNSNAVVALNYATSSVIITVSVALMGLQAHVLLLLYRKYGCSCRGQQVFWAQLKSMCFAGIMVVCFVPYHIFRLYYIRDTKNYEDVNEIFLSLTTLSCLDMLTFGGKGTCLWCYN